MNEQNPRRKSVTQPVIDVMLQGWARNGHVTSITVSGDSMRPFLHPGDTLRILHGRENLRPGDLLVFRENNKTVVHRLLQKRTAGDHGVFFYSKGDNNHQADALVPRDQVIGRVAAIQRGEKILDVDSPVWRLASQTIALSARLSLAIESWGQRAKRRLLGIKPNRGTALIRRLIHQIQAIPGQVISWMQWRKR